MWRPKGWKNDSYDCSVCDIEPEGCQGCGRGVCVRSGWEVWCGSAFEAGADAMLEALRKQPRVKCLNYAIPNPSFPFPATYYLIPDEEVE